MPLSLVNQFLGPNKAATNMLVSAQTRSADMLAKIQSRLDMTKSVQKRQAKENAISWPSTNLISVQNFNRGTVVPAVVLADVKSRRMRSALLNTVTLGQCFGPC